MHSEQSPSSGEDLLWPKVGQKSTRDTYNYGQYINQFPPEYDKSNTEFERIQKKICRHKMSIMFNESCINEEMLPIYNIYIYIYICVCVCVCVFMYVCMYVCMYVFPPKNFFFLKETKKFFF